MVGVPAAAAAGGLAWRAAHPVSFWVCCGFPVKAVRVYAGWPEVARACGLTRKATRVTLEGTRPKKVTVDKAPRLGVARPTAFGWRLPVRLHRGQVPEDYLAAAERLRHAWSVQAVRVYDAGPGRVVLVATLRDPLENVAGVPESSDLLVVTVGRLETGEPWTIDFRVVPHWLVVGATQSGKSTLLNALVKGLAPQPVALVGFDLKGGVELTPYAERLSALATTRAECVALLEDLVAILAERMRLCRQAKVRNVWRLPADQRPTPIVVVVDEIAELYLMADKAEKDEIAKTSTALLRVAQLGRAFGVYLIVAGQRVGADLGPGVTALRAQLSGRVCHRVNDPETAKMTLGDLNPDALEASLRIPPAAPGTAIVAGADGRWYRARSAHISEEQAEQAARAFAHLAPAWADLKATTGPVSVADLDQAAEEFGDEPPAHAA
ncbi:cell division protein FtsK [Carbonactinospora thermoautotrophica]|nr:cell division protein FtsK [Carbonactinospora thermoautotrophica]